MSTATTYPSPSEQLARLPEPIQEQLWRLVRLVAGMSAEEKACASMEVTAVAYRLALAGPDVAVAGTEMLTALAQVIKAVDQGPAASNGA